MMTRLAGVAAVAALLSAARPARAVDPFEIQVYDGTADARGQGGLELHLNDVANGVKTPSGTELPEHGVVHATFEPSYGIFPFWEIGSYFQTAIRDDGKVDYGGVKLRSKLVAPPGWSRHLRLGVNLELSIIPDTYDKDVYASEVRPIFGWADDDWLFIANPILDIPWAGPDWQSGPTFEPAAKAMRTLFGKLGVGFEYYGNVGPIAKPVKLDAQEQYVYEVLNLEGVRDLKVNFGIGEGLTSASNPFVIKMIVGYTFDVVPTTR